MQLIIKLLKENIFCLPDKHCMEECRPVFWITARGEVKIHRGKTSWVARIEGLCVRNKFIDVKCWFLKGSQLSRNLWNLINSYLTSSACKVETDLFQAHLCNFKSPFLCHRCRIQVKRFTVGHYLEHKRTSTRIHSCLFPEMLRKTCLHVHMKTWK